ncbi:hypothetical protein EDB19DRAFT_678995 [Suillus lakei]|nr:hypothetical protein EDB19DRAFT_678995 [Suillus lakei]
MKGPMIPSPAEAIGTPAYLVKKYLDMTDVDRRRAAFAPQPSFEGQNSRNRPLIMKILGTRQHVSTDGLLEYRVEVRPSQLVEITQLGIKGKRPEPAGNATAVDGDLIGSSSQATKKTTKKSPSDQHSNMRIWIPVSMARQVYPCLAIDYEAGQGKSIRKAPGSGVAQKQGKGKARAEPGTKERSDTEPLTSPMRGVRTHCQMNWGDDGAMKQGLFIHALAPDHEECRAGDELRSQNRLENNILSLPSASIYASTSDAHLPSGFLFSMLNPDDPMELESEDEADADGAHPSWFD